MHPRTKFVDDRWMEYYGFIDPATKPSWWEEPVTTVGKPLSHKLSPQDTCAQAVAALKAGGANQLPIVDSEGKWVWSSSAYVTVSSLAWDCDLYHVSKDFCMS